MEKAKVYYSDLRTSPTSNLLDKMERLLKRAGIEQLPLKDSFAAIKIHFGEPGNLAYLRPNYAARMATLLRSLGAKPFLTDCNTLYSGRRANAVDHLQSAMENGFNPISAQCQVIIGDGLKGTDYREIPLNGEYCPATQNRYSDSRRRYCNQYEPLQGTRTSRLRRCFEESGHGMCQCRRKAGTALRLATQG